MKKYSKHLFGASCAILVMGYVMGKMTFGMSQELKMYRALEPAYLALACKDQVALREEVREISPALLLPKGFAEEKLIISSLVVDEVVSRCNRLERSNSLSVDVLQIR